MSKVKSEKLGQNLLSNSIAQGVKEMLEEPEAVGLSLMIVYEFLKAFVQSKE